MQITSGEYDLSSKSLGHSSLQCLLRWSGHFWKVQSAHPVLLAVFAGMKQLEAFCTSSSLTVFSNRFDGDKAAFLAGLPQWQLLSLCRNIRFSNKSSESQQQKSVIPNKRESSQRTSWNHPSRSTRSWMHNSNSSAFWRHVAWQVFFAVLHWHAIMTSFWDRSQLRISRLLVMGYNYNLTHYEPMPLVIMERFHLYRHNQAPGKCISDYVAEVRRLTTHCRFGTYLNEALRDRLVCGIRSEGTQ